MLRKGFNRLVNSIGNMNLVDSLDPRASRVSKYWRLNVLASMFWATPYIVKNAETIP